jgi:Uma2 family endonuclease
MIPPPAPTLISPAPSHVEIARSRNVRVRAHRNKQEVRAPRTNVASPAALLENTDIHVNLEEAQPMTVFKRDAQHHTYADYLVWSRTYGDELVDGAAYVREPPSPSPSHQIVVGEIYRQGANALQDKPSRIFIAPFDVRLPKSTEHDDEVDTVVQPDILIVCDAQKIDGRGMRGAPDWVAEVLSPGTGSYDQKVKVPAYERAGVREVWLVHPVDRTLRVYRLQAGSYGRATLLDLKGKTSLTVVPDVTIDWEQVLAKL